MKTKQFIIAIIFGVITTLIVNTPFRMFTDIYLITALILGFFFGFLYTLLFQKYNLFDKKPCS